MKKFYGACLALALSALFLFAGCGLFSPKGDQVFDYLKTTKNFKANPSRYDGITDYKVNFVVEEDLSYTLSGSYGTGDLKSFSYKGTRMEYLGCEQKDGSYENWGCTVKYSTYYHVVKLPEATVTVNGKECAFYILADSTSKKSDSFYMKLVVTDASWDKNSFSNVIHHGTQMTLQKVA